LMAVVVLPTPPFWLAMATTRGIPDPVPSVAGRCRGEGEYRGGEGREETAGKGFLGEASCFT
jgi:hypothetical protein